MRDDGSYEQLRMTHLQTNVLDVLPDGMRTLDEAAEVGTTSGSMSGSPLFHNVLYQGRNH